MFIVFPNLWTFLYLLFSKFSYQSKTWLKLGVRNICKSCHNSAWEIWKTATSFWRDDSLFFWKSLKPLNRGIWAAKTLQLLQILGMSETKTASWQLRYWWISDSHDIPHYITIIYHYISIIHGFIPYLTLRLSCGHCNLCLLVKSMFLMVTPCYTLIKRLVKTQSRPVTSHILPIISA